MTQTQDTHTPITDYYFKGDACKYTGVTSKAHGTTWYHYELLEGHRKGEVVQQMDKPRSIGA